MNMYNVQYNYVNSEKVTDIILNVIFKNLLLANKETKERIETWKRYLGQFLWGRYRRGWNTNILKIIFVLDK